MAKKVKGLFLVLLFLCLFMSGCDKSVTITFQSNGGSMVTALSDKADMPISTPQNPVKEGHTFIGWFSDEALTQSYTFDKIPKESITLYAKWQANSYTLTFHTNDGRPAVSVTGDYGTPVTFPDMARAHYAFVYWYENEDLTGKAFTAQTFPAKDMTLYAKWQSNYLFTLTDGAVTITGIRTAYPDMVIPETMDGYPVTQIGANAFKNQKTITSATLPDSVTFMGEYAFYGCTALESITLSKNLTAISVLAFYDCKGLTSVEIPERVRTIGLGAFYKCSYLADITLPDSLMDIESYAFFNCRSLTHITLPDNLNTIEMSAFAFCLKLEAITIPDSVYLLQDSAFQGCTALKNATLPDQLSYLASNIFSDCSSLTTMTLPESIRSIGMFAFEGCKGLTDIHIPEGVLDIQDYAFQGCIALQNIDLPASIIRIGDMESTFSGCTALTSIHVDENNAVYRSIDGNLYSRDGTKLILYTMGKTNLSFTVPDTVTTIGRFAFNNCQILTAITLPDGLTTLEFGAFWGCTGLSCLVIPENIALEDDVFYNLTENQTLYMKADSPSEDWPSHWNGGCNATIVWGHGE